MITFYRAAARYRRPVLVVELLLVAVYFVVGDGDFFVVFPIAFVVVVVAYVLGLSATYRYRPAVLIANPARPAFDTPVSPAQFLLFTAFVIFFAHSTTTSIQGLRDGGFLWPIDAALVVLLPALLVLMFTTAWRDLGVRLRPDGLLDRQMLGSLFVPWEAFEPARPPVIDAAISELVLTYRHPELVRRRGVLIFGRRAIRVQNVDRAFLATIIDHYVRYPELRAAIGTEAELVRLTPSGR